MIRQLRSHSLPMQIFLPFLAILPYLVFIIQNDIPFPVMHNAQGWLYHSWKDAVSESPWLFMAMGWSLNLVTAYTLNWINIQFEITGRRTVYVTYFFSLLVFTPLLYHIFQPAMLGGFMILISLIFIFLVYHSRQSQAFLFNSGFFWGLGSLVYPPFVALFPLYILSARYVKSTRFRDFVLLFTGFLSPVWIWLSFQWLGGDIRFQWLSIGQWAEIRKTWPPEFSGDQLLTYLFFAYLIIVLLLNINLYRVKKDVGRRVVTIFGQLLWIIPIIFLLFERVSVDILWITLIPSALLFSVADENSRSKWKSDLAFAGFVVFMVIFQLKLILPDGQG